MSKEKQIEEMIEHVREVTDDCQNCNLYKDRLCDYNCDLCEAIQLACEALYNAGYRKQSEGEWVDKPTGAYSRMQSWCSACGKHSGIGGIESNRHKPYCPNCGAHMRGGKNE